MGPIARAGRGGLLLDSRDGQTEQVNPPSSEHPGPVRWLCYAFGARLPERFHDWVFADLTGPDWRIREVGRIMLFAVIPITGLLFLPGPLDIRIYSSLFVLLGPLFVGLAYGDELRDHRLRQHGMMPPMHPDPD